MIKILTFIYELAFFTLISVPIGIILYLTANLFYETKRIINAIRTNTKRP